MTKSLVGFANIWKGNRNFRIPKGGENFSIKGGVPRRKDFKGGGIANVFLTFLKILHGQAHEDINHNYTYIHQT